MDKINTKIANFLARYLTKTNKGYQPPSTSPPDLYKKCLKKGDILLIEGNQYISTAIKYLTQSTWSHAALYVGDSYNKKNENGESLSLIEASVRDGVIASPLSKYKDFHSRICRPINLSPADKDTVISYAINAIGRNYDLKNVVDLARYLLPTPPVPTRMRRKMLALGAGDPTRVICSSLIAEAFQTIKYPILPEHDTDSTALHIRHHSLFVPRDFDVSPYFQIIKPTLEKGFDYKAINWEKDP